MHAKTMAALMKAEAKNRASAGKPIFLLFETKAGHGQGTPVTKQIEESMDIYSFLFLATGHEAVVERRASSPPLMSSTMLSVFKCGHAA
jgi:hypothetical protein